MICILASNRFEAERFAKGQEWNEKYWFYGSEDNLLNKECKLILRLPSFFELPFAYWSQLDALARTRVRS